MPFAMPRSGFAQAFIAAIFVLYLSNVFAAPAPDVTGTQEACGINSTLKECQTIFASQNNDDPYIIRLNTLNQSSFTAQPYVANGYIGARLPAAGVGFQSFPTNASNPEIGGQGWPIFGPRVTASIVAGFYDEQGSTLGTNFPQVGGEQVISLIPSWPALYVTLRKNGSLTTVDHHEASNANSNANSASSSNSNSDSQETKDENGNTLSFSKSQSSSASSSASSSSSQSSSESGSSRTRPKEATYAPGVNESDVKSWTQSMSIRDGVVITEVQWAPSELGSDVQPVTLRYTVLAHRSRPTLGMMRVDVFNVSKDVEVFVTDALDGRGAARTQTSKAGKAKGTNTIYSNVQPMGLPNVSAYLFSAMQSSTKGTHSAYHPTSIGNIIDTNGSATASQTFSFEQGTSELTVWKAVGITSTDAFGDKAEQVAESTAEKASKLSWDALHDEHQKAWDKIWSDGGAIAIDGGSDLTSSQTSLLSKLQTQARASLFHILSNVRSGNEPTGFGDNSIPPAGLTSDSYAASIFWDAETFMAPSLFVLYPDYSESILNYRHRRPQQLVENAQEYGKPGILNSWVAARFQNCTGIGPCYDYEYHINNDIAFAHWQYYQQTRNQTFLEQKAFPVLHDVSQFWAAQVVQTPSGQSNVSVLGQAKYETLNLTDPDEYANFKNNGAYTNAGITLLMLEALKMAETLGKSPESIGASNWSSIANNLTLLRAPQSNIVLEYEGFNGTVSVKQADVSLLVYPLEFNNRFPQKQPEPASDLAFYSGVTDANGPGMTYSVYGIAKTQLDGTEGDKTEPNCEGFTRLLQAGMPYEREYAQFSEEVDDNVLTNGGTNPAYTFLTAHGGLLQSYTHGFLGYRARNDTEHVLYIDPNLPPQLAAAGGLSITGVRHGQSKVDVDIKENGTTVTHREGKNTILLQAGPEGKRQQVAVGQSVKVPTRTLASMKERSHSNKTNYALCQPVESAMGGNMSTGASQTVHAGTNLEQGANDGSLATYFQPSSENATSLVIDLGESRTIKSVLFNWGLAPPKQVSMALGASKSDAIKPIIDSMSVNISAPWNASAAAIVQLPTAYNTTKFDLTTTGDMQGRYVNVTMVGVHTPQTKGYGATLVEVELS